MEDLDTTTTYEDDDGPKSIAEWLCLTLEAQLNEIGQKFRERTMASENGIKEPGLSARQSGGTRE